jgi:hypothetical protein
VDPGYTATDYYDGDLTGKVTVSDNINPLVPGIYQVRYSVTNSHGKTVEAVRQVRYRSPKPTEYKYTGATVTYEIPHDGLYRFELWGASTSPASGLGAYTKGDIRLTKGTKLYLNVGGNAANYSGGVLSGRSGVRSGGATDIRVLGGAWNDAAGLRSRIMVAAGGGSYGATGKPGGYGGGLTGESRTESYGTGGTAGTQTASGSERGAFGIGGTGVAKSSGYGGAGGGGYYGGGGVTPDGSGDDDRGGGGGSSFISGHAGCNAVISETNGAASGLPVHYSGYAFSGTSMIAGNATMPNFNGVGTKVGNSGTGYAKISLLTRDAVD